MQAPSEARPRRSDMAARHASGRLLDPSDNGRARQMTVHDRTRLTVLPAYKKNNESRTLLTKELGARVVSNILIYAKQRGEVRACTRLRRLP